MRNDGDDDPILLVPELRFRPSLLVESTDLPHQSSFVEDELYDRIRRSTALRSVRSSIAIRGAGKTENNGKYPVGNGLDNDRRSYFDCNICLEAASDPVLTSCGHLFCWSCLYRWLHFDWDGNECPVCEGEVKETSLIPIYCRGDGEARDVRKKKAWELELGLTVPPRPPAKRVESSRQISYWSRPSGIEEARRRISILRHWIRSSRRVRGLGSGEQEETTHGNGVLQDEVNVNGIAVDAAGRANGPATVYPISSDLQQADSWLLNGGAPQENVGIGWPGESLGGIRSSILGSVLIPHNLYLQQIPVEMAVSGVEFPSLAMPSMVEPSFGTLQVNLFMMGDGNVGDSQGYVLSNAAVLPTPTEGFNNVSELDSAGPVPSLEGTGRRRRRNNESFRYNDDGMPPVSRRRRAN